MGSVVLNLAWSPQRVIAMHEPEFWGRVYFSSKPIGANDDYIFDTESEKVRQILYSIHRSQRSRLKQLGSFSKIKDDLYTGQ